MSPPSVRRLPAVVVVFALAFAPVTALSLISVSDEIAMGRDALKQVRKSVPVVADPALNTYVTQVGKQLTARARGPGYPYSFSVANYRELNAFALPGGPVWINRRILHASASEAQLAGVLAHYIAHLAQRHDADHVR